MVVTYYIKIFHAGTDRRNSILMSLLLVVTETIENRFNKFIEKFTADTMFQRRNMTCNCAILCQKKII